MKKNIQNKSSKKSKQLNSYLKFSAIAFQMGAIIGLGAWGGSALDKHFNLTSKLFTIILTLLSVGGALYLIIKEVIKMSKDED